MAYKVGPISLEGVSCSRCGVPAVKSVYDPAGVLGLCLEHQREYAGEPWPLEVHHIPTEVVL